MSSKRRLVTFDWAMKRLLRSKANFDILEGFLTELLGYNIKIIEILESETNKERSRDKYSRLDLKCKNHKGEYIIIEVQYQREIDFLQRILFGIVKTIADHLTEGQDYFNVVKVISVAIVYFDLGHGTDYVYHGTTKFKGLHKNEELTLNALQREYLQKELPSDVFPEIYIIKVNNFNDVARNNLDEWIYFLKNERIQDNFKAKGLKKAIKSLDILKMTDKERKEYDAYLADLRYQGSMARSTYGIGKFEGHKEGRKEGIEEGAIQKAEKVALNMLSDGFAIDKVAKYTGLTLEQIQALNNKNKVCEPATNYKTAKPKRSKKSKNTGS